MFQTIFAVFDPHMLAMSADEISPELKRAYWLLLLTVGMLFGVFLLTILLVRALRRYRQTYMGDRRKPTPSEDLWAMHRLPKQIEEDPEPPAKQ